MGTTQKTSQQGQFDPGSMQTFQQLIGALGPTASQYITNPFGNPFFRTQQQLGTTQAHNQNQTATSGLLQNMTGSGMAGGASNPAATEMLQNQARAGTNLQAGLGFLQPVQNALGMQQGAMNLASSFRPLQTGQNTTQSTGGLGTWLPQVLGAGMGIAGAAMGMPGGMGGLSSLFGGGGGGLSQFGPGNSGGWAGGVPGNWGLGTGIGNASPGPGGWGNASGLGGMMAPPPPPGA